MASKSASRKRTKNLLILVGFLVIALAALFAARQAVQTSTENRSQAEQALGVEQTIKEWTFDKTKAKGNVIDKWKAIGISPYSVENGILHGVLSDTPEARQTGTELVNNSVNVKLGSDMAAIKLRFGLSVPVLDFYPNQPIDPSFPRPESDYPIYTPEFLYQIDEDKSTWYGPLQFTVVADGQLREYAVPLVASVSPSDPIGGKLPSGTRIQRIKFHLPGVPFNSEFMIDWIRIVTLVSTLPPNLPNPSGSNNIPNIKPINLPIAVINKSYKIIITGQDLDSNDNLKMTITGLPSGLEQKKCTVSEKDETLVISCEISGTPKVKGTFNIQIDLKDSQGAGTQGTLPLLVKE